MIMENGFSSPRSDTFPAGLRVLVVDDDPTWLKILEKMLKKCSYEVTTCGLASEALKLLRDRKDGYDIVISDVNMPDMDGFKLLEHVGLEMDLPVIMMSADGETSRVMKGVQHGACDYLLKPIRMKELKNIWQHVLRKRMHEVRDIECIDDRNGPDHFYDGHFGGDQTFLRKRKDVDNEKDTNDPSSTKKARVVWTVELHQRFVKAVDQLGIDSDKIGPKKILDLMNVPWLTRENVASHLQKYRLYLNRLRKEDKLEGSCGMKNPDLSPKESSGSFSFQNSSIGQLSDISSKYMYQGNQLPVQTVDSKPLDTNPESSKLLPVTQHSMPFSTDSHNARNLPLGLNHTCVSLDMSTKQTSFDSPVSGRYPWSGEVPDIQVEPELKRPLKSDNCFNQPAVPILQQHISPDLLEPAPKITPELLGPTPQNFHDVLEPAPQIGSHLLESAPRINSSLSINDANHLCLNNSKPSHAEEGEVVNQANEFSVSNIDAFGCVFDMKDQNFSQGLNNVMEQQPLLEKSNHSIPIHSMSQHIDAQNIETGFGVALEMKKPNSCQDNSMGQSSEYELRNQVLRSESASGLVGDDVMFRWIQCGFNTSKDLEFDRVGFSGCNLQEHDLNNSLPLYVPKFDSEYPFEWVEYPFDHVILFS